MVKKVIKNKSLLLVRKTDLIYRFEEKSQTAFHFKSSLMFWGVKAIMGLILKTVGTLLHYPEISGLVKGVGINQVLVL